MTHFGGFLVSERIAEVQAIFETQKVIRWQVNDLVIFIEWENLE